MHLLRLFDVNLSCHLILGFLRRNLGCLQVVSASWEKSLYWYIVTFPKMRKLRHSGTDFLSESINLPWLHL